MIGREGDVALRGDPASRFLPWTVGFLVFLATLAFAAVMFLASASEYWRQSISGTLTVQVAVGPEQTTRTRAAIDLLRTIPGIATVRKVSDSDIERLMEPWLGGSTKALDLPLPTLIDAQIEAGEKLDMAGLVARLEQAVPGTRVDDHAVWLQRLSNFAAVVEGVVIVVIAVILFSAITTVIFTTRTGLAIHHDVVEVLHLIGAHDSYVAQQFQAHALRLGSAGAVVGFALGAGAVYLVSLHGGGLSGGLLPDLALNGRQWFYLLAMPVTSVILVVMTAGYTVKRSLGKIM